MGENTLNAFIRWTAEIISISLFLILFISFLLYFRRRLRIVNRRDRPETTSNAPPNRGLEPSVVSAIPTFAFDGSIIGEPAGECSVCLGTITEKDLVKVLPNCKHMFDAECINKWFVSHSTCPICRAVADPPRAQPVCDDEKCLDAMV